MVQGHKIFYPPPLLFLFRGPHTFWILKGTVSLRWFYCVPQAFSIECVTKKYFSYFSVKTYVVGTQKNRLSEMVLLSRQNMCSKLENILL